jgi:hypothetical protein
MKRSVPPRQHGLREGFITEAYLKGALAEQDARQKSIATTQGYTTLLHHALRHDQGSGW